MNFLTVAAFELLLLSLLAGIVGPLIVQRQAAFFAVSLSHATFPGGVIAALLGVNVLFGQATAALLLALLLALLTRLGRQHTTAVTGILLVFGFALGAVLAALQNGLTVPVEALLIGSLFGVQAADIVATALVLCFCTVAIVCSYRRLLFHTFDAVAYTATGFRPALPGLLTALLTAAAVVVAMPAVGAILGVALLIGPAVTAQLLPLNIRFLPPVSMLFALLGCALGLWFSVRFGVAAGGAIGLVLAAEFLVVLLVRTALRYLTASRCNSELDLKTSPGEEK